MAKRLLDAGFDPKDVEVIEPAPLKGNLVARYRGTGGLKPLLLLAHIDVVEAKKEDWSEDLDPFKLTERDGYFYGRGTLDDKAMARDLRGEPDPLQARRLPPEARPHRGAHRGRGGRKPQRRRVAAREPA